MVKLVVCMALMVAATAAAVAPYQVEQINEVDDNEVDYDVDMDTRMVGGEVVTDATTYSYMVAIQPKYLDTVGITRMAPFCSGVLIQGTNLTGTTVTTDNYILTSAHCALSGTSLDFYAGVNTVTAAITPDQANVLSSTAFITDEYRRNLMTGDLAIIRTTIAPTTPTATTTKTITAARLANINNANKNYLVNTVTMAGWGYPNDVYNRHSPSLRQLSSWVVPNWYCAVRHLNLPVQRSHVCTAGLPNRGPCTGDAGAPLIAQDDTGSRVIGMATLVPRDGCSRGRPGVFTRIGDYLDWISSITGYDVEQ